MANSGISNNDTKLHNGNSTHVSGNELLLDPGNHGPDHFKSKMSPLRFRLRQYLAKYVSSQSIYLSQWQRKYRTPFRDLIFLYSSSLGSHTFYVLCLPLPAWLGYYIDTKDLVYIIGLSIYISGYFKDYFCLPRPHAPPLKRITLSKSTTKEYGAPSSHTANATGASLYLLWALYNTTNISLTSRIVFSISIVLYCLTLTLGRIYCGMHGLLDIFSGAIIGALCMIGRILCKDYFFANYNLGDNWWTPIFSLTFYLWLLLYHVRPIDECPCFDDSVAFIGVIFGLEVSDWYIQYFGLGLVYNFTKSTFKILLVRLMVGFPCLVIWKYVLSKKIVYFLIGKVIGIRNDIEEREHLIQKHLKSGKTECLPFCGVSRFDIITRFVIYAGIPFTVMLFTPIPISYVESIFR